MKSSHRIAAASVIALVAYAGEPMAAHLNSMIVLGDSLSDGGRLFAITGRTTPASPPYFNGRFSNGPVWVEQLPALQGFTYNFATNFAVGGAESGTGGPLGVATQVSTLAAAAPITAGTLVVIWAGANDYQNRAATTPPGVLVPQVVGNIATATGTMIARGGRNLLVPNLPDLGRTPGGVASGAGSSLSALVQVHNNALVGAMNTMGSATGARIIVMDVFGLFTDVLANPSVYGIANTAIPCLTPTGPTPACATAAGAQGTLFFDPIHPTATAHTILAQFANATIDQDTNGARNAAVTSYLAPLVLDTIHRGVGDRLRTLRADRDATSAGGAYGAINYATGDRDVTTGVMGYDYDLIAYSVGYDATLGDSFVLGGSLNYVKAEAELAADRGESEVDAKAFAAYVGYRAGGFWAALSGAGSWENYDLERKTKFAPRALATAKPDGNSFFGALDMGLDLVRNDDWVIGPFAGARYLDGDIDAHTEMGAAMLNLATAEQNNAGVMGNIGIEASAILRAGDTAILPRLRVAYEAEVDELNHAVAITSLIGQTRTVSGGTGTDHWVTVGAGLDIKTGGRLSLSLDYQGSVDRGDGKDHAVLGRAVFSF